MVPLFILIIVPSTLIRNIVCLKRLIRLYSKVIWIKYPQYRGSTCESRLSFRRMGGRLSSDFLEKREKWTRWPAASRSSADQWPALRPFSWPLTLLTAIQLTSDSPHGRQPTSDPLHGSLQLHWPASRPSPIAGLTRTFIFQLNFLHV